MQNKPERKKKKFDPLNILIYGGVIVCAASYVFTSASGYLIPALTPFSLASAFIGYIIRHYRENKDNKNGMLRPQMIILCFFCAIPVVFGILEIIAVIAERTGKV